MKASEIQPRKLVVFDIDDTLVHTQTKVHVVKDGEVVDSLNSHDFTHYRLKPGEEFDFSGFRNAREFFEKSKPIIPMMNQLKRDIATGNKVVMVTARADFDDRELFLDTFRKFGIDMGKVHVYRAGNSKEGTTEERKKAIIKRLLDSGDYTKAIMYDDAKPNLHTFMELKKDHPRTKFYAWHVSLEGKASEYMREGLEEKWSAKYKRSINCNNPKGFSQKAHCAGRKKNEEIQWKQGVAEGIDIGQEWMTDTELDQYVPDQLQQQWRELVGYDAEGNVSALWANITGGYEPDANDPADRANMVKVANKWFAMKRIPNVRFFDVRDVGDELEWLVQIGEQGVAEGYTTEKQIMTRIRQILHDRKLSGTESNAGELHRLKQQLKDMRSQQGVAEAVDPDIYDDLDARTIVRAAKSVMPDIRGRDTDEGYVHLTSSRGLDLYIGASVADGEISINIGSGGGLATSGTDQGAVTAIIKAVYDTAVRKYGQPDTPGSLTIDDDAGHGVWQHIAQKLGLTYDSMNENFADGKVKGKSRPGRVKRAGASCKGSVTDLRKRAKNSSGEKQKMLHWCANMKSGRNK